MNGSQSPAPICQYFGPREVDTFRDPREMREKVIQYLDHPELADEMGSRAAARYRSEHTYVHRARALLEGAAGVSYRAVARETINEACTLVRACCPRPAPTS